MVYVRVCKECRESSKDIEVIECEAYNENAKCLTRLYCSDCDLTIEDQTLRKLKIKD